MTHKTPRSASNRQKAQTQQRRRAAAERVAAWREGARRVAHEGKNPLAPIRLREIPAPELPAPDWVRIRTGLCGLCGSDYKQVFMNGAFDNPMTALISFPQVLGHEVVGRIESVGPDVDPGRVAQDVFTVADRGMDHGPSGVQALLVPAAADELGLRTDPIHPQRHPGAHA